MTPQVIFSDGTTVCPLGLGTWQLGLDPFRRKEAAQALRCGIDLGMTVVDTAEMYANEDFVGRAISPCRSRVFLVGKVLPENASLRGTVHACEQSLRRLRTDHFDLYLLHWKGPYPFAETVEAMTYLRNRGLIARWGVSNFDTADMDRLMTVTDGPSCATDQILYNLSCRGTEFDLLPWCARRRMPVMAYSPVLQGALLHNPSVALDSVARRHGVSPAVVALAWTLRSGSVIAIPKSSTSAHVTDNYRALSLRLTPDDLALLDSAFPPPSAKQPLATI